MNLPPSSSSKISCSEEWSLTETVGVDIGGVWGRRFTSRPGGIFTDSLLTGGGMIKGCSSKAGDGRLGGGGGNGIAS